MNGSGANVSSVVDVLVTTSTVANSVSVLVCLLTVILVLILKLYKKVVYRLALYQVLASLALATNMILQNILLDYNHNYGRQCIAMGWLLLHIRRMDEATFHDVGNLSSLLFCGTPQESEKA